MPFLFNWGSSIYARVSATNEKGTSEMSLSGNGGIIRRVADAPINLQNVASITTGTQIGVVWEDGSDNGGSDIIDY